MEIQYLIFYGNVPDNDDIKNLCTFLIQNFQKSKAKNIIFIFYIIRKIQLKIQQKTY